MAPQKRRGRPRKAVPEDNEPLQVGDEPTFDDSPEESPEPLAPEPPQQEPAAPQRPQQERPMARRAEAGDDPNARANEQRDRMVRLAQAQREITQRNNEETQRLMDEARPTPTQEELDLAKLGIVLDEKEPDGSEPDRYEAVRAPGVRVGERPITAPSPVHGNEDEEE